MAKAFCDFCNRLSDHYFEVMEHRICFKCIRGFYRLAVLEYGEKPVIEGDEMVLKRLKELQCRLKPTWDAKRTIRTLTDQLRSSFGVQEEHEFYPEFLEAAAESLHDKNLKLKHRIGKLKRICYGELEDD